MGCAGRYSDQRTIRGRPDAPPPITELRASKRRRAASIRTAVHIQIPVYLAVVKEGKKLSDFDFLNQEAKGMLDQLIWWTNALTVAREKVKLRAA